MSSEIDTIIRELIILRAKLNGEEAQYDIEDAMGEKAIRGIRMCLETRNDADIIVILSMTKERSFARYWDERNRISGMDGSTVRELFDLLELTQKTFGPSFPYVYMKKSSVFGKGLLPLP